MLAPKQPGNKPKRNQTGKTGVSEGRHNVDNVAYDINAIEGHALRPEHDLKNYPKRDENYADINNRA